jgi:hypothetical protein
MLDFCNVIDRPFSLDNKSKLLQSKSNKIFVVLFFFSCFPWWETRLTSNKIPFGVMSCNLSFIFDRPIICKTVIYVDQSDNSWCIHSALIPKYVVGSWLIGWNTEPWRVTQNHDVTHSYGMRLDLALHSITFFRFQGNQSLLLFLNTVGFAE